MNSTRTLRECTVSIVGADREKHTLTVEASSLFAAVEMAIRQWTAYWWYEPQALEEHWLEFLQWLNQLRRRGLCIIFLHHAGKSGMQRGHSRSEDMLDVSIKLTRSEDDQEVDWLKVTMEYDKFRADRRGVRILT